MVHALLYYVVPAVIVLIGVRKYRESKWGRCKNKVRLDGKLAIVTGANSGIGYEIAKELCKRGAEVVFACRNKKAAVEAMIRIDKDAKNSKKIFLQLDLGSLDSVKRFADAVKSRYQSVHILVNNAGVSFEDSSGALTKDGYEMHFGVNHLGHFLLTNLLLDALKNGKPSRVVIVSSTLHQKGKIDFENFRLEHPKDAKSLYANSKLANMYFCKELTKRTANTGIQVHALCPGWVFTSLFRNHVSRMIKYFVFVVPAAFLFMRTPKQGAQTPLFCATDPSLDGASGGFYRDCKAFKSSVKFDDEVSAKLWDVSRTMIEERGIAVA